MTFVGCIGVWGKKTFIFYEIFKTIICSLDSSGRTETFHFSPCSTLNLISAIIMLKPEFPGIQNESINRKNVLIFYQHLFFLNKFK